MSSAEKSELPSEDELIQKLAALQLVSSRLDVPPEVREEWTRKAQQRANAYLEQLPGSKVLTAADEGEMEEAARAVLPISEEPVSFGTF